MRLQILELPPRRLGAAEETPFVIVISEAPPGWARSGMAFDQLKEGTGAEHVVCVEEVVQLGPPPAEPIRGARLEDFGFDPEKLKQADSMKIADGGIISAPPKDRC